MTIKALIGVRSGSQRVKNKNIRPFADSSLLEIKIKQLQQVPELNGVVVNSNSDEMLEIACRLGAETVKRDEYFASSEVSPNEYYENIAQNCDADIIVSTVCTVPLAGSEVYSRAIRRFFDMPEKYDSLITVSPLKEFLWVDGKALNYDVKRKPRSQDLPENFVILNHAIHILSRETMITSKDNIGETPYLYPITPVESIDIDTPLDFEFAEFMYNKQNVIRTVDNKLLYFCFPSWKDQPSYAA